MLDTENRLQNHIKNAKANKFLLQSTFCTSKRKHFAKFYFSKTFGLSFMINSVGPTRSSIFYAYLITKIENRNFNPSCMNLKVFGTHTFYKGGGLSQPPMILKTVRLYKLQLWQAIRTMYET